LVEGMQARPLPQHLAVGLPHERHIERELGFVLERLFVLIERDRTRFELAHRPGNVAVAGVRLLPRRQRAALVEFALEREGQRLLQSLLARLVVEPADADAADVTWYDRLRAGESVAARERREQQQQRD